LIGLGGTGVLFISLCFSCLKPVSRGVHDFETRRGFFPNVFPNRRPFFLRDLPGDCTTFQRSRFLSRGFRTLRFPLCFFFNSPGLLRATDSPSPPPLFSRFYFNPCCSSSPLYPPRSKGTLRPLDANDFTLAPPLLSYGVMEFLIFGLRASEYGVFLCMSQK